MPNVMTISSIHIARSVPEALAALADAGESAEILAGATWIMRSPIRGEFAARRYVAISRLAELADIEIADGEVRIGACVTHDQLAAGLAGVCELRGLVQAAGKSANPAIRRVATVGGNLCTSGFPAADLVPAMISLDASVDYQTTAGVERIGLAAFLATRATVRKAGLLTQVIVPRRGEVRSAHARLPLRKAGDYPVAIASVAISCGADGLIDHARIAIGSVEPVARRWEALERAISGCPIDSPAIAARAQQLAGEFAGRDGIEASGRYRVKVLPALVRRAFEDLNHACLEQV